MTFRSVIFWTVGVGGFLLFFIGGGGLDGPSTAGVADAVRAIKLP